MRAAEAGLADAADPDDAANWHAVRAEKDEVLRHAINERERCEARCRASPRRVPDRSFARPTTLRSVRCRRGERTRPRPARRNRGGTGANCSAEQADDEALLRPAWKRKPGTPKRPTLTRLLRTRRPRTRPPQPRHTRTSSGRGGKLGPSTRPVTPGSRRFLREPQPPRGTGAGRRA